MVDVRPKLTKVLINDVDITNFVVRWETTEEHDTYIGTANIIVTRKIQNILNLDNDNSTGYKVIIYRGVNSSDEEVVFRGEVITFRTEGVTFLIECNDRYYEAVRHSVTVSFDINIDFEAGIGSEIYKTLINDRTTLTATNETVTSTVDMVRLQKFICKNTDVYERVDALASIYNFQHFYNPIEDKVFFEPKGIISEETILEVGNNIVEVPNWKTDKSKLINRVTIKGAEQLVGYTQFFSGDGTESQFFTLQYTPRELKIYSGEGNFDPFVSGTKPSNFEDNLIEGGKIGSTAQEYDYEYDDDRRVRRVYFSDPDRGLQPSYRPAIGTNNVEVQITYALPVQVKGSVETSIEEYGLHETEVEMSEIKNFEDAYSYMQSYLNFYSRPFISSTIKVSNIATVFAGRSYRVIDSINNIDKVLLVERVKKQWPFRWDEVTVGSEILREIEFKKNVVDRIKRLEEALAESEDLLIEVVDSTTSLSLEPRYLKQEIKAQSGNIGIYGHPSSGLYGNVKYGAQLEQAFILGHPTAGVLGYSKLGEGEVSEFVTITIIPGKNNYKELIYDDEFYDDEESDEDTFWYTGAS